jgi:tetratricopeptide (TPR) repeat protein
MRVLQVAIPFALFLAFAGVALAAGEAEWGDCNAENERSLAACTRIIQDRSEDAKARASAYYKRGNTYYAKRDHDRAIADYNEAIKLDLHDSYQVIRYYNRGGAYLAKYDYDRAIPNYSAAIKLNPKFTSAYVLRAAAYRAKGDYDRAIADYDRALKIDPNDQSRKGRDETLQAKRAAAAAPAAKQREQGAPEHYLLNLTPVKVDVFDNGRTVCSLAPNQSCYWAATPGQHVIELRRQDGKSIRTTVSSSDRDGGTLHQVICPKDFGTSERSDAPTCN